MDPVQSTTLTTTEIGSLTAYDDYIEHMRTTEYPMLQDALYLDHAGTTLYSKSLMERFQANLMTSLYGNPHSMSPSSQRSTEAVERIRLEALSYFGADPIHFDLVFTANTTAAIKLVMEAFREQDDGFWFGYHVDSHTSLVGVREAAQTHRCFVSDNDVEDWLDNDDGIEQESSFRLFAYPVQSNMNGRRIQRGWTWRCREHGRRGRTYALLDAAAYASTSPLRLDDVEAAPDFTVLSFTKIFGFPDLGALIVKKDSAHLFRKRKYFGGGTVDMVVCLKEQWHAMKSSSLHEQLEDGTLPIHNIIALGSAMQTHTKLFHSLRRIAEHTTALAKKLYEDLSSLKHANDTPVSKVYKNDQCSYGDMNTQGPVIAFNLMDSRGRWISNPEVEKLASINNIHLRTGGLCNPGGIAVSLHLSPWQMRENFSAGIRCGGENDLVNGNPTGVIRVSLGAMSTRSDVQRFIDFVEEFFVDKSQDLSARLSPLDLSNPASSRHFIESLTVYPIKSCGGWQVPFDTAWDVHREGLSWDREWCIVRQGTDVALSQKSHPRMALIRPHLDFKEGVLRVTLAGSANEVTVPLSKDPNHFQAVDFESRNANVCGDVVSARVYTAPAIADFFTTAVGVPCTLARFPATSGASPSTRHSKAHLQQIGAPRKIRPILLSNESPILTISRSSLNRLNETIKAKGGKAAHPSVFRANVVLAEDPLIPPGQEHPWAEDHWREMRIGDEDGGVSFDFLGGCRRCQMVCVDQQSGEKNQEPFVTLAKTRRFEGRVLFGVHTCMKEERSGVGRIKVGDVVRAW